MKKKNRLLRNTTKILGTFSLLFLMMIGIDKVSAVATFDVHLTFEVSESSDVTLTARGVDGNVAVGVKGSELIGIRDGNETFIDFEDTFNNQKLDNGSVEVTCSSTKRCEAKVTLLLEHGVRLVTAGGTRFSFKVDGNDYGFGNDNITSDKVIEVVNRDDVHEPFDGKAYLIWSCKNGGTCYHYFDNISTEEAMFIPNTRVTDDNTGEVFDVNAEVKGFSLKNDFESWQEDYKAYKNINAIDFTKLDTHEVVGVTDMREYEEMAINDKACTTEGKARDEFERCVDDYVASKGIFTRHADLKPVGEPYFKNAYVSYGDRNFKVTIYNENYRGITIGSLDDLEYYPAVWNDPYLRVDAYDISGDSEDEATVIDTVLLEPTVNIKALDVNGFEIKSIEALDVPANAVNVTKVNDEFKIRFASNFYDNVLFKVTGTDNKVYYMRINRITLNADLRFKDNKPVIDSYFYFDRNRTYTDYVITAKIVYTDDTYKIVEMENAKEIDDGLGNVTYAYEVDEEAINNGPRGKGLKVANYRISLNQGEEEHIKAVYINVERKGSTVVSYAGAFAGSGKGIALEFGEVR